MLRSVLALTMALLPTLLAAAEDVPRSHDPRVAITLFAENPQIVTPTGIDVDSRGRVWAVESNTHFPPEGYQGHPSDRVLVLSDTDGDGRADKSVVFLDGLKHTMSVAVLPVWLNLPKSAEDHGPTVVYLATRREIFRCVDTNGDLVCDEKTSIVHLETKGDYPHNGLAGFAFSPLGEVFFGFGENLGADYRIIGSDGQSLSGGGEGGNIYRTRLDGSRLTHWATGFWNPHASCFDGAGHLFSVDNDPDSRPPCRLMHIIPHGDYGYRFRNGRKGLHPFTSWNGEIPGTLPMVAGTGEAPSGVLAYENNGLPAQYWGILFATSWGDHRIDAFRLKPRGASFSSNTEPLITGGENFRPVGIATAPDGSMYCTDWVLREYKLHGRGRVWRIAAKSPPPQPVVDVNQLASAKREAWQDIGTLGHPRLDVRRTAARALARDKEGRAFLEKLLFADVKSDNPQELRLEIVWSLASEIEGQKILLKRQEALLKDDDPALAAAVLWLRPMTGLYFEAEHAPRRDAIVPGAAELGLARLASLREAGLKELRDSLVSDDPFFFLEAVLQLAKRPMPELVAALKDENPRIRLAVILAARRKPHDVRDVGGAEHDIVRAALKDPSPLVRRAAIQWIPEAYDVEGLSHFMEYKGAVQDVLNDPSLTADLFLATLAALELLDAIPPAKFDETPPGKYVLPIVKDPKRPAAVRAIALRMIAPGDPALPFPALADMASSPDLPLRREAVRTLQGIPTAEAGQVLQKAVENPSEDKNLQLDALAGLANVAQVADAGKPFREFLTSVATSKGDLPFRIEALRGLRGLVTEASGRSALEMLASTPELKAPVQMTLTGTSDVPKSFEEWRTILQETTPASGNPGGDLRTKLFKHPGDPEAGRRAFFHLKGPGCSGCHTVDGRGGKIGPDLSTIGRSLSRDKLIDSILEPSKEIAPQFTSWVMETKQGTTLTGMIVFENEGKLTLGTTEGKTIEVSTYDIVDRRPQEKSIMPEKLPERMTLQEFQDVVAYLRSLQ